MGNPSIYVHADKHIILAVHGDDFIAVATPESLDFLDVVMDASFDTKKLPRLGPGGAKSARYLGRTLRWDKEGYYYEADQKHIDRIVRELGLQEAKGAPTPMVRQSAARHGEHEDEILDERRHRDASLVGLARYIS